MKNMRKILAAVLAVMMVLAMMPAAFAADTTYTLDIANVEDVAQGSKADGDVLAGDYFTIVFSAKTRIESNSKSFEDGFEAGKRLNFGGNTVIGAEGNKNAVKFTSAGAATIKVWWVSGGDGRQVAIYSEAGEVLTQTTVESVKNSLYVSELKVDAAGTYYVGNVDGNNNYYKLEAVEAAAAPAVPATLAEQIVEANKLANNELLPYESTITGTITDEPQASSKNEGCYKFTVSDGTNSLLCYFVPVTGGTPKKGDTVTVTGKLTAYNGKAQFSEKNSAATWIAAGTAEPEVSNDPAADTALSVADAIALGASKEHNKYTEGKYYVTGVITEVYNEKYGNMKIADDKGNVLTVYGTYSADGETRYDKLETKPVAGEVVTVYGIIGQYSDAPQMKNGWITGHEPAPGSTLSIADAIALGASKAHNTYTYGKYYVTGVITEVYNDKYGNMYITDEAGNVLTVYGTYSADGADRYDKLTTKPVAGDTVTVYGIIGQYKDAPQMKNGWITDHKAPVSGTTYTVKAGDTLGKIALAHYGIVEKYQAIFEANRDILKTPGMIYVGQVLTLPGENLLAPAETETLYTVQPGDTLGKIALAHYGSMAQYKAIFERNSTHLASPDLIYAGQVIVLPAK